MVHGVVNQQHHHVENGEWTIAMFTFGTFFSKKIKFTFGDRM